MREIKFRAWVNELKLMCIVERLDIAAGRICLKHVEFAKIFLSERVGAPTNDVKLMQYTGLKDKNGKEIYEGDVVNYSHPRTNEIIRTVTFKHGAFGIEGIYEKTHIIFGNILDSHIEVIGNIYENPELLTV